MELFKAKLSFQTFQLTEGLGLFNNYITHRGWVGLSVFRDVA